MNGKTTTVDANGWPLGFFEETFGAIPDSPERDPQGEDETRLEFESWRRALGISKLTLGLHRISSLVITGEKAKAVSYC